MKVHALAEGPAGAPAVVFASSLGTTLEAWAPQAAALQPTHRVVRYDHRGHGGSALPDGPFDVADLAGDVLELADELGVGRFSFVGLSLGGAVGQWLGAHAADRVDRLVLASTSARFRDPELYLERAGLVRAQGIEPIVEPTLGRWFTPAADAAVVERFRRMLRGVSPAGYAACCEAVGRWDFRAELGSIAAPTLAIAGRDDPSTTPDHLEAIAAAVPGARMVALDGAHICSAESPGAFTAALRSHLDLEAAV